MRGSPASGRSLRWRLLPLAAVVAILLGPVLLLAPPVAGADDHTGVVETGPSAAPVPAPAPVPPPVPVPPAEPPAQPAPAGTPAEETPPEQPPAPSAEPSEGAPPGGPAPDHPVPHETPADPPGEQPPAGPPAAPAPAAPPAQPQVWVITVEVSDSVVEAPGEVTATAILPDRPRSVSVEPAVTITLIGPDGSRTGVPGEPVEGSGGSRYAATFPRLPAGGYGVEASAEGYTTGSARFVVEPPHLPPITVEVSDSVVEEPGEVTATATLPEGPRVTSEAPTVTFAVIGADGFRQELPGAPVEDSHEAHYAATFTRLPAGEYDVEASAEGYRTGSARFVVERSHLPPITVEVSDSVVEAPGEVTATAILPDRPRSVSVEPAVTITLIGPDGSRTGVPGEPVEGSGGSRYAATFTRLPAGGYGVEASAEGYTTGSARFVVEPAHLPPITVEVSDSSVEAPGDVTVTAAVPDLFPEGSVPTAATFVVTGPGGPRTEVDPEPSRPDGVWRYEVTFRDLPPGEYLVEATVEGYAPGSAGFTVLPRPPVTVTLAQDSERSPTGQTVVLTATATAAGEGSWIVRVEGPNARTLADGETENPLTVRYTGQNPGEDRVVATWVEGDRQASAEVRHGWDAVDPQTPAVDVIQDSASSVVGGTVQLAVVLTLSEEVGSGTLRLVVTGANPAELQLSGEGSRFVAGYTGTRTGTDTITATWSDGEVTVERSVVHAWTAPRIEVAASPEAADLGSTVEVVVGLPDGTAGGTVELRVVAGPNAGRLLTAGDGAADVVRGRYTGLVPGTDVVEATLSGTGAEPAPTATAAVTWRTPAVVLGQATTVSAVGTAHTVTVEVSGTVTGAVVVTVDGANAGADVDLAGDGRSATASYTGATAGTDRIGAAVVVGGHSYPAQPLDHEWVTPVVTVSQDTAASAPGETVALTATVVPAGLPGAVTFTVDGAGPALTLRDADPGDGWTASYTREEEGTDRIAAVFTADGGPDIAAAPVEHRWTADPPPAVVLSPAGFTGCTGSPVAVTGSVADDGAAVAGAEVELAATPALPGAAPTGTTGEDGRAVLSYTRTEPGPVTLTATAQLPSGAVTSTPVTHVWEDCGLAVTVGPAGTTGPAGSSFTATVRVLDGSGRPVEGARTEWRVTLPGQDDVTAVVATDGAGLASWTWTRATEGRDRIDVLVTSGDRTGRATAERFWTAPARLLVHLGPAGTSGAVDSPFTATALVTDGGIPLPGAEVRFRAALPGAEDVVATARTGADGQASVTYTRGVDGVETITAEAVVGDRRAGDAIVHVWTAVPELRIDLDPAGASTEVGSEFTVTATVHDGAEPAAAAEVVFGSTADGRDERTGTARTDDAGRAVFTYTRDTAGPDTVQATVTLPDGRRATASLSHLWRNGDEPVPPPSGSATLAAEGALVPGGTAIVTGTGCPAGTRVVLSIDGEPVATTRADAEGAHRSRVPLAGVGVGRHALRAQCEPVVVEEPLDVVVPVAAGAAPGPAAAAVMAVFGFFVLLGGQLVRLSGSQPAAGS